VFPVRHKHHLHIVKLSLEDAWRPIDVFPVRYEHHLHIKNQVIPVTDRGDLQGCETSRIRHCLDSRLTDGGKVVSFTHRPRRTPQKHVYYFCLG
jgi:hypothetical protein